MGEPPGSSGASVRASRVFAKASARTDGVDCGASSSLPSGDATPSGQEPPRAQQRAPASCSYAAAPGAAPPPPPSAAAAGGCPVAGASADPRAGGGGGGLNPLNNIPASLAASASAASTSAPGLSGERAVSSIPMAPPDTLPGHQQPGQERWVYPSERMFYNAMQRKGWDPQADDMHSVVSIHNAVNEQAWREVMAWERLHCDRCPAPRLKRFQGRPSDLSPKARLLNFMGFGLPFDRHDWVVDRCGQDVRYVIDFYNGAPQPGQASPAAFFLDVRPALDSVEAGWDRVRMQLSWVLSGRWMGR